MAASQLNEGQKKFKKAYNEGRKILENEFGKSMRYKSIRELSAKESGLVLKDIKPIWLMSPYSVSDCLPLDSDHFDVVIFDEASQITLEEGVPALYRSRQTIIVGDEKQMPPTDFFSAKSEDPDDLEQLYDLEDDEWLSADADSLLEQGARKLNSTLLSWHYRSHYETLISFSNHAFYEGGLLTIPDKTIHHNKKRAIEVSRSEEAVGQAGTLFDRSISFHYYKDAVYEKRSNMAEAGYIAHLVRELLSRNIRESIGIVAFSQEQQHAISDALDDLATKDAAFSQKLEEAFNRTEDDQFTGLIIKNLENIQGDERDIIIMSVCYGYDRQRKMLMNFGPVNKRGGEKRLNVLFSRAKKHMAVISSIRHTDITNEYNDGAAYLRRFLQYAERTSLGDMDGARAILQGLVLRREGSLSNPPITRIARQIMEQVRHMGFEVAEQVGQSGFKCSLAVKSRPEDEEYTLGILIDDDTHYQNKNLIEQYYQRPAILRNFGWKILPVFAKDWLHQPQKVIEQIRKEMSQPAPAIVTDSGGERPHPIGEHAGAAGVYDKLPFLRLHHRDAQSDKFWEAATDGNKLIIRWGRTGSKGQIQLKTFSDAETAEKEMKRSIKEKTEQGYLSGPSL
jgi:predicted DNA-binding WGR domain protein